jgi:hypothetical protein
MTTNTIGFAAGAIWKKLHEKGSTGHSFGDLKKITGYSADEIVAGIGWLAREGKICFKEGPRKTLIVSLVEEAVCVG